MKKLSVLLLLVTCSFACTQIPSFLTKKKRDWDFVQSVGGMAISADKTTLTIDCDVSGLRKVTVEPTLINSGIGVWNVLHRKKGNTISLTLVTSVIGGKLTTSPKPLDLSSYPKGRYEVVYRDPDGTVHPLGAITLKKESE